MPESSETLARPPLRKITAENFLSFQRIAVPLNALNVLVGPNGAGKTNLLSIIRFLGETARTDLRPAIETFGGYERIMFRGGGTHTSTPSRRMRRPRIRIAIEAQITKYASPGAPDEYQISFRQSGGVRSRFLRIQENFTLKRVKGRGRRITVSGGRIYVEPVGETGRRQEITLQQEATGLAVLRRLNRPGLSDQVNELATLLERFRVFDVDVEAVRRPKAGMAEPLLAHDGGNVALFMEFLKKKHKEIFDAIEDDLRHIVPGLIRLHLERVGEGVAIEIEESGLSGRTPLSAASFGTVRALAVLAMLHDPSPPRLSCIEEIDHGFHPYALDRIVERLRLASERTQILVATHSPALVNRLRAEELIVCERDLETGGSTIPAIEAETVREMEERSKLHLGELWFSGTLRGVP